MRDVQARAMCARQSSMPFTRKRRNVYTNRLFESWRTCCILIFCPLDAAHKTYYCDYINLDRSYRLRNTWLMDYSWQRRNSLCLIRRHFHHSLSHLSGNAKRTNNKSKAHVQKRVSRSYALSITCSRCRTSTCFELTAGGELPAFSIFLVQCVIFPFLSEPRDR